MSLLSRIAGLEATTARPSAGDDLGALPAELTDEELDRVVVNLLLAGGPPSDAAVAEVWRRATTKAGLNALTGAEFDALYLWLTADDGDGLTAAGLAHG
jgi:hypothetical protein